MKKILDSIVICAQKFVKVNVDYRDILLPKHKKNDEIGTRAFQDSSFTTAGLAEIYFGKCNEISWGLSVIQK